MSLTVVTGPFTFMTKAQLDLVRLKFAANAPEYSFGLAGANVNGQSFTFTHSGVEYAREEFAALLQHAYWQLGVTEYGFPPGNRSVAHLGGRGFY